MTLSHEFVRLHKSLTYDALSGAAIEAAKARCMDYLGALAGGINGPLARPMLRAQAAAPCSPPESSVLATPLRAPCATASRAIPWSWMTATAAPTGIPAWWSFRRSFPWPRPCGPAARIFCWP